MGCPLRAIRSRPANRFQPDVTSGSGYLRYSFTIAQRLVHNVL